MKKISREKIIETILNEAKIIKRKKELFDNALHTVYNELKSWPEERYFVRDGGFKNWMLELEKKASNHEVLEANYRMKFEKYKIEKLPERPFCF